MKPNLRFKVKSAVPGLAERDSVAPPTTMVSAEPGPVCCTLQYIVFVIETEKPHLALRYFDSFCN